MDNVSNLWHIDPEVYQKAQAQLNSGSMYSKGKQAPYIIIESGEIDKQRVVDLYQRSKVSGYEVARVDVIFNKTLVQLFEAKIQALEQRHENPAFDLKWKADTKDGRQKQMRERIAYSLEAEVTKYAVANRHVKILPMFHGTNSKLFDSIFRTGFDNLASTDAGFFGKGLYNTSYAEYAWRVYSTGGLLFNWVAFYSAFPVIKEDMKLLIGAAKHKNYDAHYALVRPMDPSNPKEKVYLPIAPSEKPMYDELVVFESAQVLPRYSVTLGPVGLKLQEIAPKGNKKNLMQAMSSLWKKMQPTLQVLLKKKMEQMEQEGQSDLTKEDEWLQDQIDQINVNEHNQDKDIPGVLIEQMENVLKIGSAANPIPKATANPAPQPKQEQKDNPVPILYERGLMLLQEQNAKDALGFFKQASDLGHAPSQWQLSQIYKQNREYPQSIQYAQKAAEQGHPDACDYIGHCYHNGYTLPKDPVRALPYFKKGTAGGNISSMQYMAIYLREGLGGCPKDTKESFKYLKMAADAGNGYAQWQVSQISKAERNFADAFAYGLKAADNGIPEAQDYIGHCFYNGLSTDRDVPRAITYFIKAAMKGNQSAIEYLRTCASQGFQEAQAALSNLPGAVS